MHAFKAWGELDMTTDKSLDKRAYSIKNICTKTGIQCKVQLSGTQKFFRLTACGGFMIRRVPINQKRI